MRQLQKHFAVRNLVRRYSHLSPSHLHTAVETVTAYGKPTPKIEAISNGTVTETGTSEEHSDRKGTQVAESIGAGDGI